ncbi:metallophosphoesterase [Deinococcus sonorensis]|uniref:Metallophosphoesterase n=2 Tax=Deinococcus sonorensis TaxID=309891 RepID=A0AAU7U7K8_9DEIO
MSASLTHRATRTLFTLLGGTLLYALSGAYRFRVSREAVPLRGLTTPLRVVQLSDLHYGNFIGARTVRRWVDAVLQEQPELIVITGDFLDSGMGLRRKDQLLRELARLSAPLGVYAVYGNHDWTSLNTQAARASFARRLEEVGIQVINNAGVQLRPDLYLAGTDDWWFGNQDTAAMMAGYQGGAALLLSHNPDFLPNVPPQISLTLCGHTHGGQVQLPLLGAVKRASLYGTRFLEGWVNTAPAQPSAADGSIPRTPPRTIRGYISHGLGVTGVPLRLACPAELTVFDFGLS